jgi:hypothetical protein
MLTYGQIPGGLIGKPNGQSVFFSGFYNTILSALAGR